jgi:hypothetical protein
MPHKCARIAAALVLFAFCVSLQGVQIVSAQGACHGCDAGNLIPNCNFDSFSGAPPRQVPSGWTPFVLSGSLTFMQDSDTLYGAPSLRMWSNGDTFMAGIYTQVGGLQPGATYRASVGWAAPSDPHDSFGRRLGIDPTGGTDPNAPTVVWSNFHFGDGRRLNCPAPDPNIDVAAAAKSSTVTVFVEVHHNYSTGNNYIFIDAVSLTQDSSAPVAPPPPTATPVPPTSAPVVQAPPAPTRTAAPTRTPTPAATATATPSPTATATATASPTPTASPSPTATETPAPTLTVTLIPRPTATAGPRTASLLPTGQAGGSTGGGAPGLLWGGIGSLGGAAILGMLAMVRTRRNRR